MRPDRGLLRYQDALERASEERLRADALDAVGKRGRRQPSALAEGPFSYRFQPVRKIRRFKRPAPEEGVFADFFDRFRDYYLAEGGVPVEGSAPYPGYHASPSADLRRLRDPHLRSIPGVFFHGSLRAPDPLEREPRVDGPRGFRHLLRPQVLRQHVHGASVEAGPVADPSYHCLNGGVFGIRHEHRQLPRAERGHVLDHRRVGGRDPHADHSVSVWDPSLDGQRPERLPGVLGIFVHVQGRKPGRQSHVLQKAYQSSSGRGLGEQPHGGFGSRFRIGIGYGRFEIFRRRTEGRLHEVDVEVVEPAEPHQRGDPRRLHIP